MALMQEKQKRKTQNKEKPYKEIKHSTKKQKNPQQNWNTNKTKLKKQKKAKKNNKKQNKWRLNVNIKIAKIFLLLTFPSLFVLRVERKKRANKKEPHQ